MPFQNKRLTQEQLKQNLRIQTYQFINKVQSMFFNSNQYPYHSRQQLYSLILSLFYADQHQESLDQHYKFLQCNFQDKIKKQYFEKQYDLQSLSDQISLARFSQRFQNSDIFQQVKEEYDDISQSNSKLSLQKNLLQNQITKYNTDKLDSQEIQKNQSSYHKIEQVQQELQLQESQQFQNYEQNDSSFVISQQQNNLDNLKMNLIKKKTNYRMNFKERIYRSYTCEQRKKATNLAKIVGFQKTSKILQIPKKNIIRWASKKQTSMSIRGRKPVNPDMEENLRSWISQRMQEGRYLTQTQIRLKAIQLAKDIKFKASKGWLQKFFRRNKEISERLAILLNEKRQQLIIKKESI